jgi:hypothetical protein
MRLLLNFAIKSSSNSKLKIKPKSSPKKYNLSCHTNNGLKAMTPEELERHADLIKRAKILSVASEQYFKAARAIEIGESEDLRYRYIKSAKDSIKDAFPEVFEVRTQAPKYLIKEDPGHRVIKTIAVAALILGILYSFVKFGPTGDLSKTWTADDIPKATAYPK